jgi:tripartite-type tricarboxylate transporter receptor subunit TctC
LIFHREVTIQPCHSSVAPIDGCVASRRRVLTALGATALAAAFGARPGAVFAQESSSWLARIIVPFAPGAAVDVVARMLVGPLAAQWGKTVIVENRPGGRTLIAAEAVARSEPDGETLLFCLDDTFTIVPHLSKPGTFDPTKELVPVNLAGMLLHVLVVNPSLPVDSLPGFVEYGRAHPGAINYSSSGSGSALHLAMEMLKAQANINIVHVPYRGLAPAMTGRGRGRSAGGRPRLRHRARHDRVKASARHRHRIAEPGGRAAQCSDHPRARL